LRVLGVDPGLGRTGVALVEGRPGSLRLVHVGCIETAADEGDGARLLNLSLALGELAGRLLPEVAAVERLYFSTNRQTAMRVSEARGVILCALAAAGVPVAEYTPNEVKESIAGYGAATKRQVARMSASLLGVERIEGPDDAADACAAAICHHHRAALRERAGPGRGPVMAPALEAAVAAARARARPSVAPAPAGRPA
jgi:crossover junction endodeoxyribonuclease RuvC